MLLRIWRGSADDNRCSWSDNEEAEGVGNRLVGWLWTVLQVRVGQWRGMKANGGCMDGWVGRQTDGVGWDEWVLGAGRVRGRVWVWKGKE